MTSTTTAQQVAPFQQVAFSRPYVGEEEANAAAEVIKGGWIVGGAKLQELERQFAELSGVKFGIGVSSWTTGAFLTLLAWDIGPGDEVIVPSYSFIATTNVIRHCGATPVFCDIDPLTHNIDVNHARKLVSPRTKAIIPVDQLGMPCDMDAINALAAEHDLHVLQDAACAIGSTYKGRPAGKDAEVAIFSLHARKIVTCGEGGMIVTNSAELAEKLRLLRHHGMNLSDFARHNATQPIIEQYVLVGYNMRITDIQAAMALEQLKKLPEMLRLRRLVADTYARELADCPQVRLPQEPEGCVGNWQSYMLSLQNTSLTPLDVMAALQKEGIATRRGVMASHMEPCYTEADIAIIPPLPNTEAAVEHNLQLPIHPFMTEQEARYVATRLKAVLAGGTAK